MKHIEIKPILVEGSFAGFTYNGGNTAYSSYSGCLEACEYYVPDYTPTYVDIDLTTLGEVERLLFFWNRVYREGLTEKSSMMWRTKLMMTNEVKAVVADDQYDSVYLFLQYVRPLHWMIKQPEINEEDFSKLNLKF